MNLAALSLLDEGEHGAGNQASSWENHDAGGREAGLKGSQEGTALGKVPSVPVATACPRALLWLHLGLVATPLSGSRGAHLGYSYTTWPMSLGKGFQDQEGRPSMCVFMYYDPDCF